MDNKQFKILFFGDITGKPGRIAVRDYLLSLSENDKPDFVIANAENASHGFGLTKKNYLELSSYGIDCFTSGNHIWDKKEIFDYILEDEKIVRPINYPADTLGTGCRIFEKNGKKIAVLNALGQVFMAPINSPWEALSSEIENLKGKVDYIVVDFHAEATAEKMALGRYLSERGVSFFTGTHTHVQTADEKVINGMAYITDAGFCGSPDGVIGMDYESSLKRFLSATPVRYEVAEATTLLINAVEVTFVGAQATDIKRINISYVHKNEGMEAESEGGP